MEIRPYTPADRAAVRHICCETADAGQPVEGFFSDRELIADLVTRYFTDFVPQHSWVAEDAGQVVGYLTGTLTPVAVPWRVLTGAAWRALWQRQTWRFLWRLRRGRTDLSWHAQFPGDVHINLLPAARGRGAGRQLMEQFLAQARAAGCRGVHASVRGDNQKARDFFTKMGFLIQSRRPLALPRRDGILHTEIVIYGLVLTDHWAVESGVDAAGVGRAGGADVCSQRPGAGAGPAPGR